MLFSLLLQQRITYIFLACLFILTLCVIATWYFTSIDKSKVLNGHFIHGEWERKGVDEEGNAWIFRYQFDKNSVKMKGQPTYFAEAKYRVLKEDENLLTLELSEIEGDLDPYPQILSIAVDKRSEQLTIDSRAGYRRV